jgi:membrane protein
MSLVPFLDLKFLTGLAEISVGTSNRRHWFDDYAAFSRPRLVVKQVRYIFHVVMDAFYTFLADDGWAIASHIALSTLMALFPFLIVLTSLAGFFGSKELADQAAGLMLQVWPKQVADSLSGEIHDVLTTTRGDVLTIGAVLAVYFASNGVEALRIALNRAYSVIETRRWYWLRLESIGYTLVAAVTALAMAFLIVLGPLILEAARRHIPLIVESNEQFLNVSRYGVTITALIVALFILHLWVPAGRRSFLQILPGIVFTLVASLVSGVVFGQYLARFANNYVTMYAGLASVIIALVFLYFIAAIFVYGGELNAAIIKSQLPHGGSLQAAQSLKPSETRA